MTTATIDPQALKSAVADAIEDGTHAVKRAIKSVKHGVEQAEDVRDEAARCIKQQPLTAVAVAAAGGFVLGLASALTFRACARRMSSTS